MPKRNAPVSSERAAFIADLRDGGRFYFEALGRFISEYSYLENELYLFLVLHTGMGLSMANAVLSGTKTDGAISFLRRIYAARNLEVPKRLNEALVHIAELNTARNEIVHHGTFYDPKVQRYVSNSLKAHVPERIKKWRLTTSMLEDMAADAQKARLTLQSMTEDGRRRAAIPSEVLARAWRYKPQPGLMEIPKPQTRQGGKGRKAPPTPPQSGQG